MILNLLKISDNTNLLARWQSWSIASDLKSDESLRIPWVRIPLSPLLSIKVIKNNKNVLNRVLFF